MSDANPVVYFIQIGKYVKIGFTTNIEKRMKVFSSCSYGLRLLATVPGDYELERRLHRLLKDSHLERELFRFGRRLAGFIEVLNESGIERAMEYLEETDPQTARVRKEEELRRTRDEQMIESRKGFVPVRMSAAEKDAYFASLVADRKRRVGW